MSWPMPNAAQWNPGMGMNPNMNMGSYTPEQWTAMQQQNWQQWTQWQQQYAQWQKQYGDKYAQQMQAMSGVPPPPSGPAQPPPPPDKPPPPPPPHENNQPLYGNKSQPSSVLPLQQRSYASSVQGNAQWTSNTDSISQPSVNTEALKKLAEEQRLFDIQFKKWEEEIDKWRKENVNHPDKQAYKDYEERFEACRAQLMERREQMKQKKDRLLSNANNTALKPKPPAQASNISSIPPPPPNNYNTSTNFNQNSYTQQNISQNFASSYQQENLPSVVNNSNNIAINTQDTTTAYQQSGNYSQNSFTGQSDTSTFLPSSSSSKGIPGLDLVPEPSNIANKVEIIDITEEKIGGQIQPDYTNISKGINSILGDEKIMNILLMVRGDLAQNTNQNNASYGNNEGNNTQQQMHLPNNQQHRPGYGIPNSQYPQGLMQQGQNSSYGDQNSYGEQNSSYGGPNMQSSHMGQNDPNMRGPGGPNIRPGPDMRQGGPDMRMEGPNMRQGGPGMTQPGPDNWQGGPGMNQPGPNMRPPGPGMPHSIQQGGQHYGFNAPNNINQGGPNSGNQQFNNEPRPLMQTLIQRPVGPSIQDNTAQQSINKQEYYREPDRNINENIPPIVNQPAKPKWIEETLFTPSIVVEYEHKPLRLKARDFIDPVHTFDYNHKSKDEEIKKRDFGKEVEELFVRKPRREHDDDRYSRELFYRDSNRSGRDDLRSRDEFRPRDDFRSHDDIRPREDFRPRDDYRPRDDIRSREPLREFRDRPREEPRDELYRSRNDIERRNTDRYDERRRDDRDRMRREDFRDRRDDRDREDREFHRDREERDFHRDREERDFHRDREERDFHRDREERDFHRDRTRELRREDSNRSRSKDKDSRKRGLSKDSDISILSEKKIKESFPSSKKHVIMIDDLLEPPGRDIRPEKIVIILRGPPGSGKSYLAKLIRDREAELGGTARIMSIDDYFMQEGELEEKDPITGKIIKKPTLKYEYDESSEEIYFTSLKRAFKRTVTDGYFSFLIFDAVNDTLKSYADIWNYARQNNFQVYICTMDLDPKLCFKRNIHNRSLSDIETICARFFPTPDHHIQLDPTTLLQNAAIQDVHMEDVQDEPYNEEPEVETVFTSKWEKMDDVDQLARLDGINKPLRPSQLSMEDYLQLDEWKPNVAKPGKKTVRWADIEERREQEKMRAIGFVVGQTDWNRMTDPTMGSSALTQTKYIERVRKF